MCCNGRVAGLTGELRIEVADNPSLLAEIHLQTVSFAYREYFPTGSPPPTHSKLKLLWEDRLADQSARAYVASLRLEPVGAVAVRQDPDFDSEGQLLGLHVLPDCWGLGYGTALHDTAIEALRVRGHAQAGL
jgi:ribosomal protein S18 acetylase RimI-like enzyme